MKNFLDKLNGSLDTREKIISDYQDKSIESIQRETLRIKKE